MGNHCFLLTQHNFENRGKPVDNVVHCYVTIANQECKESEFCLGIILFD